MIYKDKCSPVFDAHPRLHVIRNNVEKVTLDVDGNTESVFTSCTCKYKSKQRCWMILNLEEKMKRSQGRASQNRPAFVFIKYTYIFFLMTDRFTR